MFTVSFAASQCHPSNHASRPTTYQIMPKHVADVYALWLQPSSELQSCELSTSSRCQCKTAIVITVFDPRQRRGRLVT